MPFKLRKATNLDMYYVVDEYNKKYSSSPLDKETALRQMKALYSNEGIKIEPKKTYPNRARMVKGSEEALQKMALLRSLRKKKE
jgi:hypothetical protein